MHVMILSPSDVFGFVWLLTNIAVHIIILVRIKLIKWLLVIILQPSGSCARAARR